MAFLNNTFINGTLTTKDKYEIGENDRYNLAELHDERKTLSIGSADINMDIKSNDYDTNVTGNYSINSEKSVSIDSSKDISLHSKAAIKLSGDRLVLGKSNAIYGVEDPNDLDLHDIEEGTVYFRLVSD